METAPGSVAVAEGGLGRGYARPVLAGVADSVLKELGADGYERRLHGYADAGGPFEIRLRGQSFDIDDVETMVRVAETSASDSGSTPTAG